MKKLLLIFSVLLLSACANIKSDEWVSLYTNSRSDFYYQPSSINRINQQDEYYSVQIVDNGSLAALYGVGSFSSNLIIDCKNNLLKPVSSTSFTEPMASGAVDVHVPLNGEFRAPYKEEEFAPRLFEVVCN